MLRTLGAGGMGLVLLARDERLMREVAVKFVSPALLAQGDSQQRFLDEARAMARVRHANVVEVFAFDEHEGKPYFVMEYVPGITADTGSASACWPDRRRLWTRCWASSSSAAAAPRRSIESGPIHGDLKPQNVLLGPAFRVALADLGLAHLLEQGADEGIGGTPAYMAPESGRQHRSRAGAPPRRLLPGRDDLRDADRPTALPGAPGAGRAGAAARGQASPASQARGELPAAFDAVLEARSHSTRASASTAPTVCGATDARASPASERKFAARILVVDDDADFLALVDRSLRAALPGIQVVCVPDGARALDQLAQRPFDLLLLDLRLPDYNGVELTATIRAEERGRRTPILVVTAHGGGRDWQLLSTLGADGFLVKPVDPHALAAMVARMLAPGAQAAG